MWLLIIVVIFNTCYWGYQFAHPKGPYVEYLDIGDGNRLRVWKYGENK